MGITVIFFQQAWTIIGPMISAAVKDFFRIGHMPNSISVTKLVVLSKVNQPITTSEFRTISCYNVMYKCVSELLCKRLKEVLPSIIHPSQVAFIKGREISIMY